MQRAFHKCNDFRMGRWDTVENAGTCFRIPLFAAFVHVPQPFRHLTSELLPWPNPFVSFFLHAGAQKALLAKLGAGEDVTTAPPVAREVDERADEDDDDEGLVNTLTFFATCARGS